ncbi:MAG: transcriptional regulator [Egibacteraceae bacterium]
MKAAELCARIREDLRDVEARIRGHRWLERLEAGEVSPGALQAFAGEQLDVIASDLRSFTMLADRFADEPAHGYLTGMAAGEQSALEALRGFVAAVGLDATGYEPIPGCQAYPSYVARLARDAGPAEVAGAFLVNLEAWGGNCARMARALVTAYHLTPEDCAFFSLFAAPTDDLERASLAVIDAGLRQGADPAVIARAARLLQSYELLFWDSLPVDGSSR